MQIDERDTLFSRMNLEKGTANYESYYALHPEHRENDDRLRSLPNLGGENTMTYHPVHSRLVNAIFRLLSDINPLSEGRPAPDPQPLDPARISQTLKDLCGYFGAVKVGITPMKEDFYYSVRGRKAEAYGEATTPHHPWAIAFAVEMDRDRIDRAPQIEEALEVVHSYLSAGMVGLMVSYFIREMGYEARNHMDGNYLLVAPLVAQAAGLGEIGRTGLLVTPEFGPRIRLGVVTTTLPLIADSPVDFGLSEFCAQCAKCIRPCPAKAIPSKQILSEGRLRWQINQEACYEKWRTLGTDCGICLSACPFSQLPDPGLVARMKGNPGIMKQILEEHEQNYGIRRYIQTPLPPLAE